MKNEASPKISLKATNKLNATIIFANSNTALIAHLLPPSSLS